MVITIYFNQLLDEAFVISGLIKVEITEEEKKLCVTTQNNGLPRTAKYKSFDYFPNT